MPLNDTALNAMADHLASLATQLSLHSADPGATGANETTAGRVAAAWPAASSGDLVVSGKQFTGGASNGAVTHVGLWSTDGTTFYGGFQIPDNGTNDLSFNAAGEYTVNDLTINGAAV